MEVIQKRPSVWMTGLAMFSMFFGAGNIVFPLAIGQMTQDKNLYAIIGLSLTAVLVPLLGLLATMLFNGDYLAFFKRVGKWPGFALALMILGLIGPFGGIPRCITISFSTLSTLGLQKFNLFSFSLLSCALLFLFTFKPNRIISLLGGILTPVLLISLGLIVAKGFWNLPTPEITPATKWNTFSQGFLGGYNTMDLLASFFFSSVILLCLKCNQSKEVSLKENRTLLNVAIFASILAAALLMITYICFSYIAAGHSQMLGGIKNHEMLGTLAAHYLGPYAGPVAGSAIAFACFTTELALTLVSAQFLRETLLKGKINHATSLAIVLLLSFLISTLHFEGISLFLVPILQMCYPALIVLSILNFLYKLYDFKPVKVFVYATFAVSVVCYFVL